jgi:alkylation response protein AidB-like acyl-CoA dehydrogenase
VGIGRSALEMAVASADERRQLDRPIAQQQAIEFTLADMAMKVDAARLLARRAAWLHDQGVCNTKGAAIAKCFAGDKVMQVTMDAAQVLGGYGCMKDCPLEIYMRDAKLHQIY